MPFQPERNLNPENDEETPEEKNPQDMTIDELFEQDLGGEEALEEVIRRADEEELQRLKEQVGLSEEELELAKFHVDLRDEVLEEVEEEIKTRKEERPEATKEEMELGAYREAIEPQVRDAVFKLRKKGYSTVSSGFGGPASQEIYFRKNDYLEKFEPQELKERMKQKGVELDFSPRSVEFVCQEKLSIEDIKEVWNTIAEELPELEEETEKSDTAIAEIFRKRQGELED